MIKIFENLYWRGKLIISTRHFYEEWEALGKPFDFVIDILEYGEHHLVSKRQNKYNCLFPWHGGVLCLAYVEHENYLLIHIKPRRRR